MVNGAPFVCDECGKCFKRKHDLIRHKQTHMTNPLYHYCDEIGCTHKTLQKSNLSQHQSKHLNQKLHKCAEPECSGKAYTQASSLIRHEKQKHGRETGKPYIRVKPSLYTRLAAHEQEEVNTPTLPSIRFDASPFEFIPPLQCDSASGNEGPEAPANEQGDQGDYNPVSHGPLTPSPAASPSTPSLCDSSDLGSAFAQSPFPTTPLSSFAPNSGYFNTVSLAPEWLAHQASVFAADQFVHEQTSEFFPAPEFIQGSSSSSTNREQLALTNADYTGMTGMYAPEYPELVAQWDQGFWGSIPRDTQGEAEGSESFDESSGAPFGTNGSVFDAEPRF